MPEVRVVVELRVSVEEELDPVALEHAVWDQGRQAAKEPYRAGLRVFDDEAVAACGGARQRLEERWVGTIFGRVRIWRYRAKGAERQLPSPGPGPGAVPGRALPGPQGGGVRPGHQGPLSPGGRGHLPSYR